MHWRDGYIAVDWGTTNRRAYRIENGVEVDSFEDDLGLMSVPQGGFPGAAEALRERLGDVPMLLAGMVGSNRGWREVPYVACPADTAALARSIVWLDPRTGIVPGVCQQGAGGPDVMRGEEVQVVGAHAAGLIGDDALVCHPGTHAKWIEVRGGRIQSFRTMMTGEVFGLLGAQSILSDQLVGTAAVGKAFAEGVGEVLAGEPPLSALFRIRARYLLEGGGGDGASRASGILIGSEVGWAVQEFAGAPIALIGRPELCDLYAEAIRLAGQDSVSIDGAQAFLAGIDGVTRMLP